MLLNGARDARTIYLGGFFMLVAASFTGRLLAGLTAVAPPLLSPLVNLLRALPADAFLPAFLWLFVTDFPRAPSFVRPQRVASLMARLSTVVASALLAANAAIVLASTGSTLHRAVSLFDRYATSRSFFWLVVLTLVVPALPTSLMKARVAPSDERRRLGVFLTGLALGIAPIVCISILANPQSPLRPFLVERRWPIGIVVYGFLLSVPISTGYSVLVDRVLDVRLIIRRAVQYALARYALLAGAVLPGSALVWVLYVGRHGTLAEIAASPRVLALIAAAAVPIALLPVRARLLTTLNRVFFREGGDVRAALERLAAASRRADGVADVARALAKEVEQAMRPESLAVLVGMPPDDALQVAAGSGRSLRRDAALVALLQEGDEPLDVGVGTSVTRLLPKDDLLWLADGGFVLLTGLCGSDGQLVGLIAAGEKRSEQPSSKDDRLFLKTLSAAAGAVIENRLLRKYSAPAGRRHEAAAANADLYERAASECSTCLRVLPAHTPRCACGATLQPARVPAVLAGKFALERRLGAGGMGVVYLGRDLTLERKVAIKTLPKVSTDRAMRLRREARTMAAVQHPNLAIVYGVESWHATPMLIVEHLEGGTLADRLKREPRLPAAEVVGFGIALASALESIHAAGLLHRDIKPSNIGYSAAGIPKLLDFGLARLVDRPDAVPAFDPDEEESSGLDPTQSLWTTAKAAGTPAYMSPEAIAGHPPTPAVDLWGVGVVLWEALTGVNPFRSSSVRETARRIREARPGDLLQHAPDAPAPLASAVAALLARDARRRPASAAELRATLERA